MILVLAGIVVVTTSSPSETHRARLDPKDLDSALGFGVAIACLAMAITCGQVPQRPTKNAAAPSALDRPSPPTAASTATTSSALATPQKIEPRHTSLEGFRSKLKLLQDKQLDEPLRVLWLGDSHTAGIAWPATAEQSLLKRVPSGGPGYIPLGLTAQRQHGAKVYSDPGFDIAPHPPAKRSVEDDGVFGLSGYRVTSHEKSLEVVVKFDAATTQKDFKCELLYRYQRALDRLSLNFAGKDLEVREPTVATFPHAVRAFGFTVSAATPLRVRTVKGNPELFGLIAETSTPGLVIDVLGINGARFATPLAWNEESWTALVAHRHPALAVIAYGTNEVFDEVSPERYEPEIVRLLKRVRTAAPDIECLLAGPTGVGKGGTSAQQRARDMDAMERRVAEQQGCAYFSAYETMGGALGFSEWLHQAPALAAPDGVHLTQAGYRKLGTQLGELLLHGLPEATSISASAP